VPAPGLLQREQLHHGIRGDLVHDPAQLALGLSTRETVPRPGGALRPELALDLATILAPLAVPVREPVGVAPEEQRAGAMGATGG